MMGDITISQWTSWKHIGSPSKRHHITIPEVLELDSDVGKVWRPMLVAGDQASWAIVHMLGDQSGGGAGEDSVRDGVSPVLIGMSQGLAGGVG